MKKQKVYFIILALTVVLIFSSAAVCNLCGINPGDESSTSEIQGEDSSTVSGDNTSTSVSSEGSSTTQGGGSTTQTTQASETTQAVSGEKSKPTITLKIYEGPTYSPADNVCYYRLEANVTGNPAPKVTFSKDYSNGSFGSKKVQINLEPGESYTLTATAVNSEGTATATKDLTYGCSEGTNAKPVVSEIAISNAAPVTNTDYQLSVTASDPDGDVLSYSWSVTAGTLNSSTTNPTTWKTPGPAGEYTISLAVSDGKGHTENRTKTIVVSVAPPVSMDLAKVAAEGGYVEKDGRINAGGCLYAGDTELDKAVKGFISFDISSLAGATIQSANAVFSLSQQWGDPLSIFDGLALNEIYWGPRAIQNSDSTTVGTVLQQFNASTFSCSNAALKTALQNAINAGRPRFQLRIHFYGPLTGNPGVWDGWEYQQSNVKLSITYTPGS